MEAKEKGQEMGEKWAIDGVTPPGSSSGDGGDSSGNGEDGDGDGD